MYKETLRKIKRWYFEKRYGLDVAMTLTTDYTRTTIQCEDCRQFFQETHTGKEKMTFRCPHCNALYSYDPYDGKIATRVTIDMPIQDILNGYPDEPDKLDERDSNDIPATS